MRFPDEVEECSAVGVLDDLVLAELTKNAYEEIEEEDITKAELEVEQVDDDSQALVGKTDQVVVCQRRPFESLELSERSLTPPRPSIEEPPVLELKPLPSHLKYAYLGEESTLPVIISSTLDEEQENRLLEVLKKHKGRWGGP